METYVVCVFPQRSPRRPIIPQDKAKRPTKDEARRMAVNFAKGELFVVAFFGVGAVCGTYWLCTEKLAPVSIDAGLAVGLLTGAVLLVNNHRDAEADARVGRRTLAILAGPYVTNWLYAALMVVPFGLLFPIGLALPRSHVWLALMPLPLVGVLISRFIREPRGRGFNRILLQTVRIQFLFGLLLSVGLVL